VFNWLKRKTQLAVIKSADEDIDRFIASLRGADPSELNMIVALATHWRNAFALDGFELLDPVNAERKNPAIGMLINKTIKQVQKDNPTFAVGLMVWLHTLRAANIPEIRHKGRMMWSELQNGFDGALEAGDVLRELMGVSLRLADPARIPIGLEPSETCSN
jgi:hypothetical protein